NGASLHGDFGTGRLLAFEDTVQRTYVAAGSHARIVRFPSGQLPYGPPAMSIGRPAVKGPGSPVAGKLDELVLTQEQEPSMAEDRLRSPGNNWPRSPFL